jgi:prepilin-type N-terminal cleavage/methylation domain-containing protein
MVRSQPERSAFTLIELLVVIAIIAILKRRHPRRRFLRHVRGEAQVG